MGHVRKKALDSTDKKIIEYIKSYSAKYGYPPTIREITKEVGFRSTSTTLVRLHYMNENKIISFEQRKSRTLKVL